MSLDALRLTCDSAEMFKAFEELQTDIFNKYRGEALTPPLLNKIQEEFLTAINLWRCRPALKVRTRGKLLQVSVTSDNGKLIVTPSDDLKVLLEDLIRETIRGRSPNFYTGTDNMHEAQFRSQINVFVKAHGRLMSPFLSAVERPEIKDQHIDHLFLMLEKNFNQLFYTSGLENAFHEMIKTAQDKGRSSLVKGYVELIAIKSALGADPERLVRDHNLGDHSPNLELSGAATDVLHKLFWFGPQNIGDLPSKSGESELMALGFCRRFSVQNAPKGFDDQAIMLTPSGLGYAYKKYEAKPTELLAADAQP